MSLPPVTVVVASYRKAATLRACLDAVLASDHPDFQVLVVDSGSADGTLEVLARHFPRVRVEHLPGSSLPAALNRGIALAGRRDVVRLHGDVVPQRRDWLTRMATTANATASVGVVGVKLVHANGRIQSLGRDLVTGLGFGRPGDDRRAFEFDDGQGGEPIEVDAVRGACAYYRRQVLDRVGLDEAYAPAHGDDDDFCLAARYHGFSVFVDPAVTAVHHTPHLSRMTAFAGMPQQADLVAALSSGADCRARTFAYFAAKWGFDPLGPDLHEIRRRYGHTAICWRIGEALRYPNDTPQPCVDIAFVTCNSARVLPQMLAALAATRWPHLRAYAVDNGSTDGTLSILEDWAGRLPFGLQIHRLPLNVGVAPAMNLAFTLGSSPLVARLDDDAIVTPDWLERLVPRFAQRPFAGVVAPRVLHAGAAEVLQARPGRAWPMALPRGTEPVRYDGLMRLGSLCGCCNLYRRDVLERAGLLDIRYAPTQYDDTDHHIAIANRGYEVLHDGTATVRHLLNQGRSQTSAAMSSAVANQGKLVGKWGGDVLRRLDRGIDLSNEGRFLPADGDTSAFLARLPAGSPPTPTPHRPDPQVAQLLATRADGFADGGAFDVYGRTLLASAEHALARGDLDLCSSCLWFLIDAFPHLPEVLSLHARRTAAEGDLDAARRLMKRAINLRPDDTTLRAQAAALVAPSIAPASANQALDRAVVLPPYGGGPDTRHDLAHALAEASSGRVVTEPGSVNAAVVHVHAFDLDDALLLLDQVKAARVAAPGAHIVLSPWTCDPEPGAWATYVLPTLFRQAEGAALDDLLAQAAMQRLVVDGRTDRRRAVAPAEWLQPYQQRVLDNVDEVAPFSAHEVRWLRRRFARLPPMRDPAWPECVADGDDGAAFRHEFGQRDFVLVPGPLQPEHNQLLALYALRDWPCVVIGAHPDPGYAELCRRFAGPRTTFLPPVSARMLRSAVAAARLVALPTFLDRPTASHLYARAAGTPVLCTIGSSLAQCLGSLACPVDPCDVTGMRAAAREQFVDLPVFERQLAAPSGAV